MAFVGLYIIRICYTPFQSIIIPFQSSQIPLIKGHESEQRTQL